MRQEGSRKPPSMEPSGMFPSSFLSLDPASVEVEGGCGYGVIITAHPKNPRLEAGKKQITASLT